MEYLLLDFKQQSMFILTFFERNYIYLYLYISHFVNLHTPFIIINRLQTYKLNIEQIIMLIINKGSTCIRQISSFFFFMIFKDFI